MRGNSAWSNRLRTGSVFRAKMGLICKPISRPTSCIKLPPKPVVELASTLMWMRILLAEQCTTQLPRGTDELIAVAESCISGSRPCNCER